MLGNYSNITGQVVMELYTHITTYAMGKDKVELEREKQNLIMFYYKKGCVLTDTGEIIYSYLYNRYEQKLNFKKIILTGADL